MAERGGERGRSPAASDPSASAPGASDPSRIALVTGASRGIGRELAIALSRTGLAVGLLARDRRALAVTAAECPGPTAVAVADVTDIEAVRAVATAVAEQLGPVDLLVNNAGRIDAAEVPLWRTAPTDWWAVVEANLRGPYNMSRVVVPDMVARGKGRVVNLNSGFGTSGVPSYSAYSVSKSGLARLTDVLARSLAGTGVVVLDVSPGAAQTDMTSRMPMFAGRDDWTPVAKVCELVVTVASGRLDVLSGRYLHAAKDDPESMAARAAQVVADDARVLRLRPYGPDDPLAW